LGFADIRVLQLDAPGANGAVIGYKKSAGTKK